MAFLDRTIMRHSVRNIIENKLETTELTKGVKGIFRFKVNGKTIGESLDYDEIFDWYSQTVLQYPERIISYFYADKDIEKECKEITSNSFHITEQF